MAVLKKLKGFVNEKWALIETPVPTKRCDYYISNYGRIKSVDKRNDEENFLKGSTIRGGYKQLNLRLEGGRRFSVYVHKIVAENFVKKKKEEQTFAAHIDMDNSNNYYKNLKWMTRDQLTAFQIKNGVYKSENKKRASNTKMTVTKVRMLKKRLKAGRTKKKILARNFKISYMQLNRIERGENWAHVTLEDGGLVSK